MEPNYWAILGLCFGGAAVLISLFWLNHKIRTRGQPKSKAAAPHPAVGYLGLAARYTLGHAEDVKPSGVSVSADPAFAPPVQTSRYVESAPPDTSTTPIPPVSDTGIGIDTAKLANSLTEAQRLEVMALARGPRGKWIYSGRKLYTLFGGNYNDFVATMRRLRNGEDDDPPEEPTVLTPIAGRPTKASYYPDQPDLDFQPPPR